MDPQKPALDGETFKLVSESTGWYQIKLNDGSAFVSTRYAELIEEGGTN
jgi:hypothetical protein